MAPPVPRATRGGDIAALLSGGNADFADYLTEQVFHTLPAHLQTVLLRISILDRFDGDLVNALCERDDGWAVVEEIKSRGCS